MQFISNSIYRRDNDFVVINKFTWHLNMPSSCSDLLPIQCASINSPPLTNYVYMYVKIYCGVCDDISLIESGGEGLK